MYALRIKNVEAGTAPQEDNSETLLAGRARWKMVQTDLIIVLMYCTGKIYGTVIEGLIVFRRRELLRACHTTRVFVNAQSMTRAVNPDSHSFSFLDPGPGRKS